MSRKTEGADAPGGKTLMIPACSTMNKRCELSPALPTKRGLERPEATGKSWIACAHARAGALSAKKVANAVRKREMRTAWSFLCESLGRGRTQNPYRSA